MKDIMNEISHGLVKYAIKAKFGFLLVFSLILLSLTSCSRSTGDVWEDTKSAGRHMGRGFRSLGGKNGDSRQIHSRDDFCVQSYDWDANMYSEAPLQECDFIPLQDERGNTMICMDSARPPRENPGDRGSSIPSIDAFQDPSVNPQFASIFQPIQFEYNSDLVKGQSNLNRIRSIADFMKRNNNVYVFVEGHCDERGPEAYNLALGARRSNTVRNILIKEGVSPDNLFTVSYGKEKPLVMGADESAWSLNRRVQFKIYTR